MKLHFVFVSPFAKMGFDGKIKIKITYLYSGVVKLCGQVVKENIQMEVSGHMMKQICEKNERIEK